MVSDGRLLHQVEALERAIERAKACLARERARLANDPELLQIAVADVARAIHQARRWVRELESEGEAVLRAAGAAR